MAHSDLARIVFRSRSPLPRPAGTVRVPLMSQARLVGAVGGLLGVILFPLAMIPLPLGGLSSEACVLLFIALAVAGLGFGVAIGTLFGDRWGRGRAIAFDADGIWREERGVATRPLPWRGLSRREDRTETLVAEDGRTLRLDADAVAQNLDSYYLAALLRELPKIPSPSRVPTWLLAAMTGLGILWIVGGARYRPPLDAEGPYWSPDRYLFLSGVTLGALLTVGTFFPLLIRGLGTAAPNPQTPTPFAPSAEELAERFRSHRFRPPVVDLEAGRTYRYLGEEFWATGAKARRKSCLGLAFLAPILSIPYVVLAMTTPDDGRGNRLAFLSLAVLIFAITGGISLFARAPNRSAFRLTVEGDRARVSSGGRREAIFAWPPARFREATGLDDWTDELRDGRRRVRFDRRLLVPIENGLS